MIHSNINRADAPLLKMPSNIAFPSVDSRTLSNGIKVIAINKGEQDIIKLDLVFKAGKWFESSPLVSSFCSVMLREGTLQLSAEAIANQIDYYGATLKTQAASDHATLVLYSLNKHLAKVLPLIKGMLKEPSFPDSELQMNIQKQKQYLLLSAQKNEAIATRAFYEEIFGPEHPYGYQTTEEKLNKVKREQLIQFHQQRYRSDNCTIFVGGKLSEETFSLLEEHLGSEAWNTQGAMPEIQVAPYEYTPKIRRISQKDSVQTALRIGMPVFNKTHEDYPKMDLLNMLLGGFFSSRLMKNIREDKGYTYGIHSMLVSLKNSGYFLITSEVGADVEEAAIKEIFKEITRLKEEKISNEEVSLLRNYVLGSLLNTMNGVFNQLSAVKGLYLYGLGNDYLDRYVNTVQQISADHLQEIAIQHLDEKRMVQLIVGK